MTAPEPVTRPDFGHFCHGVVDIVGRTPEARVPERIAGLLPALLDAPGLLTDAQRLVPETGYGRYEIFLCPRDAFSVLAVVWPPGISTPIHDHAMWCAFGVYEGVIRETRYAAAGTAAGGPLAAVADVAELCPGMAGHLPVASPNIHCIHNPTDRPAISIHVYGGNSRKLGPNVENIYTLAA